METTAKPVIDIAQVVNDLLDTIDKDREREIITRRFGLEDRKETLEEIGKLLGITRERVRQIEKQTLTKLQQMEHDHKESIKEHFLNALESLGRIVPLHEVSDHSNAKEHSHVNFLAHLIPEILVINESDDFYHSLALKEHHSDYKVVQSLHQDVLQVLNTLGKPVSLSDIHKHLEDKLEEHHLHGILRSSKHITTLDDSWGLASWPQVNPKSIRDKVYIVLSRANEPMHFNEIADKIKSSDFKRKDVTTQAIHNELIKDPRFVLVGRGIYALDEWGFSQGTVADVIESVLKKESPLHRDEIVKRVLQQRQVKPTTVVLNLQGKDKFKRVSKATYTLVKE
ncbi:MAG: sigma factor-like helix-turn-helix DNA-binding protein [Candidatus Saccharimonadales bacterium]